MMKNATILVDNTARKVHEKQCNTVTNGVSVYNIHNNWLNFKFFCFLLINS